MDNGMMKYLFPVKSDRIGMVVTSVMFIDPGITGTGYAFYPKVDTGKNGSYFEPTLTGTYIAKKSSRWDGKVEVICSWFDGLLQGIKPQILVIEFPEFWAQSSKSMTSVERGDLFKLTFLIGGLGEVGRRNGGNLPLLISPQRWKGQLPKDVMMKRLSKLIAPGLFKDHHCADAIGMGLSAQGVL